MNAFSIEQQDLTFFSEPGFLLDWIILFARFCFLVNRQALTENGREQY